VELRSVSDDFIAFLNDADHYGMDAAIITDLRILCTPAGLAIAQRGAVAQASVVALHIFCVHFKPWVGSGSSRAHQPREIS